MEGQTAIGKPSRIAMLSLALLQGLALWYLLVNQSDSGWLHARGGLRWALIAVAVYLVPAAYSVSDWWGSRRTGFAIAALAALLLLIGAHYGVWIVGSEQRIGSGDLLFEHSLASFVLLFHLVPFIQTRLSGRGWLDYPSLFAYAWRNALRLAVAGLFTGVLWGLLALSAALFKMIGINTIHRLLFVNNTLYLPITALGFGLGVYLSENSDRLLSTLRQQVLSVLKWLCLLSALILVLFTLALLWKSPALFASHRHVISAAWLLWLVVLNVYLYNAAWQDGRDPAPFAPVIARGLRMAAPLLAIIAMLAAYALIIRVRSYGLTAERGWALLVSLMALIYALGYAWSARIGSPWMATMGRVNGVAALALCAALFLMLTPVLSPYRLAAHSLAVRLVASGDDIPSDTLNELVFRTGEYGRASVRRIAGGQWPETSTHLREVARDALQSNSGFVEVLPTPEQLALEVFPAGAVIEPDLRQFIAGRRSFGMAQSCRAAHLCAVMRFDWNGDGVQEAMLIGDYFQLFYMRDAHGQWRQLQSSEYCTTGDCSGPGLRDAVRAGQFRLVPPLLPDLEIAGQRFHFDGIDDRSQNPD